MKYKLTKKQTHEIQTNEKQTHEIQTHEKKKPEIQTSEQQLTTPSQPQKSFRCVQQ